MCTTIVCDGNCSCRIPGVSSLSTAAGMRSSSQATRKSWHISLLPLSGKGNFTTAHLGGPLPMDLGPGESQVSSYNDITVNYHAQEQRLAVVCVRL